MRRPDDLMSAVLGQEIRWTGGGNEKKRGN